MWAVHVDIGALSDMEKTVLAHHGFRIRARERLEWMDDLSSLFGKEGNAHRANLSEIAYSNDPKQRDRNLERLSRI